MSMYFMGRDPNLWDDPLSFDPERFSSDKQLSHPYLFTPFSAGPRFVLIYLLKFVLKCFILQELHWAEIRNVRN